MKKIDNIGELVEKYDALKKQNPLDLSSDQDLVFAIMNLVSIEEHLIFTGLKTGKDSYFELMSQVREARKRSMQQIIKEYEGEVWCTSKHLLAACMRFLEVGTKQQSLGNAAYAKELFERAYEMYCLFWGINMDIISSKDLKWVEDRIPVPANAPAAPEPKAKSSGPAKTAKEAGKKSMFGKLGDFIKEKINCCIE